MIQELKNAKPYIIDKLVNWIKTEHPSRTTEYNKCSRDLGMIVDAIVHDLENAANTETQYIANKFWSRGEPMLKDHTVELQVYDMFLTEVENLFSPAATFDPDMEKVADFISTLKSTVLNGPVYTERSWDKVINNRIMTFNWTDDVPLESDIQKIIQEMHEFVPSKQRRVRYSIDVVANSQDDERKHLIYAGTKADPSNPYSRHNPQVLAPWLISFSIRYEANTEGYDTEYFEKEAWLDIGLASQFISLSALTKGLDVGFCQCIQNREEIQQQLGFKPVQYLGIGHRDPSSRYYCPVYNKFVDIPARSADTKPLLDTYTRWH